MQDRVARPHSHCTGLHISSFALCFAIAVSNCATSVSAGTPEEDLRFIELTLEEFLTTMSCKEVEEAHLFDDVSGEDFANNSRIILVRAFTEIYLFGYSLGQRNSSNSEDPLPEVSLRSRCEDRPDESFSSGSAGND